MTSRLLHEVGHALYGERWQTALSKDLGVSDRTMRRWASGVDDPPDGVWIDLLRIVMERAQALDDLVPRIKEAGAPGGSRL